MLGALKCVHRTLIHRTLVRRFPLRSFEQLPPLSLVFPQRFAFNEPGNSKGPQGDRLEPENRFQVVDLNAQDLFTRQNPGVDAHRDDAHQHH